MEKRKGTGVFIAILVGFLAAILLLSAAVFIVIQRENRPSASEDPVDRVVSDALEKKLEEVRANIEEYYLFDMDDTDFDSAIIKGYVDALGDPYTVYYTREEYQELLESNKGTYSGVGIVMQQDPDTRVITVVRVYENTPASREDIQSGDIFKEVNGVDISSEDVSVVASRIRGDAGTSVSVTFYRPSTGKTFEVTMFRQEIAIQSVTYKMLDDQVGYLEISTFDEQTYGQFMAAYRALEAEGMKSIIFDLRDNGGGLVSSVTAILDQLLPKGIITYTVDRQGYRDEYTSDAHCILDIPAAVLTNENTASASEIFVGAVQYYEKATIVGTTTFGKGIVQVILPLSDGSGMKITVSNYYTPAGVCIHGIGIEPDIEVEYDYNTEEDEQLNKALEVLKAN